MNKYALEVLRIGGEKLMNLVSKEFASDFFIVARTQEYIVLGDGKKNVSFCRIKNRVLERFVFERENKLERKK
jgi:hypothetical protein